MIKLPGVLPKIRLVSFFVACLFGFHLSFAQRAEKDYTLYHKGIINAEYAIFIDNDSSQGLKIFKTTFDNYDFVFVDDCIEAFQLALFFKREDYAMQFIRKALENGFELKLLDQLSEGCPCNFYSGMKNKVTIHEKFIKKNKAALDSFSEACYKKYLQGIDKELLAAVLKRHVREQLFKNYHTELGMTMEDQKKVYYRITDENLHFMDSLADKKIFLGERNLGVYTNKLAESMQLPYNSIENCEVGLLKFYGCPKNTSVPIISEEDYFSNGPVYIMLFHNPKSYATLSKYKDEAIRKGYMHPREFASLRFNYAHLPVDQQLFLRPIDTSKKQTNTKELNKRRNELLLPSYEIDYNKHVFAHRHHLMLCFGFFNGTR